MAGPKSTTSSASSNAVRSLLRAYNENTSSRLKFIDAFLLFLMLSGVIQFVYCILVTNFPFNAFLAGYAAYMLRQHHRSPDGYSFGSCVGQFVLTASLRSQVNPVNRAEFKDVSPERYASRFGPIHLYAKSRFVITVPLLTLLLVRSYYISLCIISSDECCSESVPLFVKDYLGSCTGTEDGQSPPSILGATYCYNG